jgi:enamine deaminase RidA (YjgF/YER057c/UK114 family)
MNIYDRLEQLSITLPCPPARGGIYTPVKQSGCMLYVSGQGPSINGKPAYTGKAGDQRTVEEAQEAARICAMNMLSVLNEYVKDLNRIKGVVKLLGFVESSPGFNEQPTVINAASQLFVDVFGNDGWHARSAVGVNELPSDITVEIEGIFELKQL